MASVHPGRKLVKGTPLTSKKVVNRNASNLYEKGIYLTVRSHS